MTTTLRDSYHELQLSEGASQAEVHASFRRLSKHAHPDVGGSTARFEALAEARDTVLEALSTPPKTSPLRADEPPANDAMSATTPATLVAFPIALVGGVVGLLQFDRSLIIGSFVLALLAFIFVTASVGLVRQHRKNIEPQNAYLSPEELIRLRAEAIRMARR